MYTWNDGVHPAGRRPRLYLAKGEVAVPFMGENIEGFAAIAASEYEKDGKWSSTTYTLLLAPGVRPLEFLSPMHGLWGDSLTSWGEVCETLGLSIDCARGIVAKEYPTTAKRLDALEAFALSLPNGEAEVVVISFGSPTNRRMAEGFWTSPKSAKTTDGRVVTVRPRIGEEGLDWEHPLIVAPPEAVIISSRHRPGMHGGYQTVTVAVAATL